MAVVGLESGKIDGEVERCLAVPYGFVEGAIGNGDAGADHGEVVGEAVVHSSVLGWLVSVFCSLVSRLKRVVLLCWMDVSSGKAGVSEWCLVASRQLAGVSVKAMDVSEQLASVSALAMRVSRQAMFVSRVAMDVSRQ